MIRRSEISRANFRAGLIELGKFIKRLENTPSVRVDESNHTYMYYLIHINIMVCDNQAY